MRDWLIDWLISFVLALGIMVVGVGGFVAIAGSWSLGGPKALLILVSAALLAALAWAIHTGLTKP